MFEVEIQLLFFFSFASEPKFLFLVVGNCLAATGHEGKLWYGALLEYFLKNVSVSSAYLSGKCRGLGLT